MKHDFTNTEQQTQVKIFPIYRTYISLCAGAIAHMHIDERGIEKS